MKTNSVSPPKDAIYLPMEKRKRTAIDLINLDSYTQIVCPDYGPQPWVKKGVSDQELEEAVRIQRNKISRSAK